MREEMVTQMKMRTVTSFLVGLTLAKHFSISVTKHAIFIIHGDRCLMCMKIKVVSKGSLRNMFFLISTVPEKDSHVVLKKKKICPDIQMKRIFGEERKSMI